MASFMSTTPIISAKLNIEEDKGRISIVSRCITSNVPTTTITTTTSISTLPITAMSSPFCFENSGSSGCSSLSNSPTSSSASVLASTPTNSENCVSPIAANTNLRESFRTSTKGYFANIVRHQTTNNSKEVFNVDKIIGTKTKIDNSNNSTSNSPHLTSLIFETNKQTTTAEQQLEGPIHDTQFDSLRHHMPADYSLPQQLIHPSPQNHLTLLQQNIMHQSLPTLNNDDARTLQLAVELSSMMNLNEHLINENAQQLQPHMRFEDTNSKYYSYGSYQMDTSTPNKSLLQRHSYNPLLTNQSLINTTLNDTTTIVPLGTLSEERSKKSQNMTECVPVPSSEHVAEIVGRQGCKIKALRAKTNTYIKTPVRNEEPVFVVTGRKEDVNKAKCEILSAAEHFTLIRATRRGEIGSGGGSTIKCGYLTNSDLLDNSNSSQAIKNSFGSTAIAHGQVTIQVRVPYRVVGLVVGPKGNTIKHIQHETQTYIVTPSRDKEPIFEVTGFLNNVQAARKHIEAHIATRTGSTGTSLTNSKDNSIETSSSTYTNLDTNLPITSKLSEESFVINRLTNHYNSKQSLNAQVIEQHLSATARSEMKTNVANILTSPTETVLQYCTTLKNDRSSILSDAKLECISPYKQKISIITPSSSSSSLSTVGVNLVSTNCVEPSLSTLNTHLNHIMKDNSVYQMDLLPPMYEKGIQNLSYECQQQLNVQKQAAISTTLIDHNVSMGNMIKMGVSSCGSSDGGNAILNNNNSGEMDAYYNKDTCYNKDEQQRQLLQEMQIISINGASNFNLSLPEVYDNIEDQTVNLISKNKAISINNQASTSAALKMVKLSNKASSSVNAAELISCLGNSNNVSVLTRSCSSASSNASSSSKSLSQYSNSNGIGNGNVINTNATALKKNNQYQDILDIDEGIGESPNTWKLPKKLGVITSSYCPTTINGNPIEPNAHFDYNEVRNKPIIIHGPMEHNGKTRIKRDCCICNEKEMVAALIPCGHKMFCVNCANNICASKEPVCPFCCMRVYQAVKILN